MSTTVIGSASNSFDKNIEMHIFQKASFLCFLLGTSLLADHRLEIEFDEESIVRVY